MIVIYTCFCLFDVCLLSYQNQDSYRRFIQRIFSFLQGKYLNEKKQGQCGCSLCRPSRYSQGYWKQHLHSYDNNHQEYYVCCHFHAYRCFKDISLRVRHVNFLNTIFLNHDLLSQFHGNDIHLSCLSYYFNDILTLDSFCPPCKRCYLRSEYFSVQEISVNRNDVFREIQK